MKSKPKISICGLNCSVCPAFLAYKNNDQDLRVKTAKAWAQEFHDPSVKPEHINCLGCLSAKQPIYKHCLECGVRLCGLTKKVKSCGYCAAYNTCPKIANLHQYIPEAKVVCDRIKKSVK